MFLLFIAYICESDDPALFKYHMEASKAHIMWTLCTDGSKVGLRFIWPSAFLFGCSSANCYGVILLSVGVANFSETNEKKHVGSMYKLLHNKYTVPVAGM